MFFRRILPITKTKDFLFSPEKLAERSEHAALTPANKKTGQPVNSLKGKMEQKEVCKALTTAKLLAEIVKVITEGYSDECINIFIKSTALKKPRERRQQIGY